MNGTPTFLSPPGLEARLPPEYRGVERDEVRLLVTRGPSISHRSFRELPDLLDSGDLLVVNRSATLPASLPARGALGGFRLNLSTRYGDTLWVAEPRWAFDRPGPLPLADGDRFRVAGIPSTYVGAFPGIPRLGFVEFAGDVVAAMRVAGTPIRYGYLRQHIPLAAYQTLFGTVPGSVEMPSAGRPFTSLLLERLRAKGVDFASVTLHAGVSSLELEDGVRGPPIYPEPFEVPSATVERIRHARAQGRRVIAVGTTVVRALESAISIGGLRAARGFTRAYIHPGRRAGSVDGLVTGFHEPRSTHLAMLESFLDPGQLRDAYADAAARGYLWHEFGDSHLILRN